MKATDARLQDQFPGAFRVPEENEEISRSARRYREEITKEEAMLEMEAVAEWEKDVAAGWPAASLPVRYLEGARV